MDWWIDRRLFNDEVSTVAFCKTERTGAKAGVLETTKYLIQHGQCLGRHSSGQLLNTDHSVAASANSPLPRTAEVSS
jgi:hypothetical protein